jgi:hypothetical protein
MDMTSNVSIWTLKTLPMETIVDFIAERGGTGIQARMASMPESEYACLTGLEAKERLAGAIARMDEDTYDEFLLEIIDE